MDDFPCKAREVQSSKYDVLGCLLLKTNFFVFIKWGSLAMSAPYIFGRFDCTAFHICIIFLVLRFLCFYAMFQLPDLKCCATGRLSHPFCL
jgi:hypothetical protein